MSASQAYYQSEIGVLEITGTDEGILSIHFTEKDTVPLPAEVPACLQACVQQLDEYFTGQRQAFSVPLQLHQGTDFEQRVWAELLKIPFGHTRSYMQVAEIIGNPKAVRAVGRANARNNIAIIVPCHRVIGSNGNITGYAGGLWRKRWLLEHEGRSTQQSLF